jgi:hypothetical protein
VIVYKHTFSGVTYIVAARQGERGWVLVSVNTNAPTVILAAITYLNGLGGLGIISVCRGQYNINATIAFTANQGIIFEGEGHGASAVNAAGSGTCFYLTADVDCFSITDGQGIILRDFEIFGDKSHRGGGRGIYITGTTTAPVSVDLTLLQNLYIHYMVGQGVYIDGGVGTYYCRSIHLERVYCYYNDNTAFWIRAVDSFFVDCVASTEITKDGFDVNDSANWFIGCKSYHAVHAFYIRQSKNWLIDCQAQDCNNGWAFRLTGGSADDNILIGCIADTPAVNSGGFYLSNSRNQLIGCRANNNNAWAGFYLSGSAQYNLMVGCYARSNTGPGFYLDTGPCDNSIVGCFALSNTTYGIRIKGATSQRNRCFGNTLIGNTSGAILDEGTNTALPTLVLPFVSGTTFLSADGAAWGWEIDAATEYAIALGHLPAEVQQIVRINVRAVSLVLEADHMRLEINGYGGTDNEPFSQETIAVANKPSTSVNFAANDYVYWTLTSTDDADIGHLLGADSVMFKVLYEDAGDGDCATDAVFLCVEIQYV